MTDLLRRNERGGRYQAKYETIQISFHEFYVRERELVHRNSDWPQINRQSTCFFNAFFLFSSQLACSNTPPFEHGSPKATTSSPPFRRHSCFAWQHPRWLFRFCCSPAFPHKSLKRATRKSNPRMGRRLKPSPRARHCLKMQSLVNVRSCFSTAARFA